MSVMTATAWLASIRPDFVADIMEIPIAAIPGRDEDDK